MPSARALDRTARRRTVSSIRITVGGDKELARLLGQLPDKMQKNIAQRAIRRSAERVRGYAVANIMKQGLILTGNMLNAFQTAPIRSSSKTPKKLIRIGMVFPERVSLGIGKHDKFYYPTVLEYGSPTAPAYPFARPAVDENYSREVGAIASDIGRGLDRAVRRRARG